MQINKTQFPCVHIFHSRILLVIRMNHGVSARGSVYIVESSQIWFYTSAVTTEGRDSDCSIPGWRVGIQIYAYMQECVMKIVAMIGDLSYKMLEHHSAIHV